MAPTYIALDEGRDLMLDRLGLAQQALFDRQPLEPGFGGAHPVGSRVAVGACALC